jgi:AcrR family transcriptional regulator
LVGAGRGAPYKHFADKEDLLNVLAIKRWEQITKDLEQIHAEQHQSTRERLSQALFTLLGVARNQPHLYELMFTTPSRDPQSLIGAASKSQDAFLAIVADVVG